MMYPLFPHDVPQLEREREREGRGGEREGGAEKGGSNPLREAITDR